jgi:hypothetical protein
MFGSLGDIPMKLKWILLMLGIFTPIILYILNPNQNMFVPDEMAGRWVTDSPKYKDCYLELSSVTLVYRTGEDTIDVNFVQSVEKQVVAGKFVYTINYKNCSGGEGNISFLWDPSTEEIRLKNQKDMGWKKITEPF